MIGVVASTVFEVTFGVRHLVQCDGVGEVVVCLSNVMTSLLYGVVA